MYFWGKDVTHPKGNQLQAYGFKKSPSQGLSGTSCYTYTTSEKTIELYGSCAAHYSKLSNIVFLRKRGKFYQWQSNKKLIAGCWSQQDICSCDACTMFNSLSPFLEWWILYEKWIIANHGEFYRKQCYNEWGKVNSQQQWLDPKLAIHWLENFLVKKEHHTRPKSLL